MENTINSTESSSHDQSTSTSTPKQQPPKQVSIPSYRQPGQSATSDTHPGPARVVYVKPSSRQPRVRMSMQRTVVNASVVNVRDYMRLSYVSFLLCFPIGIFAIIYSNKVREANRMGDEIGAKKASQIAGVLNIVGLIFGGLLLAGILIAIEESKGLNFGSSTSSRSSTFSTRRRRSRRY